MADVERLKAALADRYRIERELGAGGMATVFLAQDLKHDRHVALKVLKPELAAVLGAERFVVEIKTTASLQHPHILPLFDSGSADGFLFYVMPFIDGETLRGKLDRETQFGVDEAVRIACDVASALHYAHEHGVIHRDIKPENILLHDGRPMVADFGIALALSAAAGGRLTETGLSLGTPHYMSPEQATAEKEITARSDVYSLGSVLYEMLAGEPPHTGASAQAIIMKIVTDTARPLTQLRKSVPPNVAAAVAKAVEKLPADRFATAKEFAEALTNPSFTIAGTAAGGAFAMSPAAHRKERAALPLAVALAAVIVVAVWGWLRSSPPPAVARLAIALPDSAGLQQQPGALFSLSDAGTTLVYVGPGEGDVDLFVRPLDALAATRIPASGGADSPFLAPDGSAVAFYRGNPPALYSVSLRGGPRQTLAADSTTALGGDSGPDGKVYFVRYGGLRRVPAGGGEIEQVTQVDSAADERRHAWPDALPNGRGVLFTILRTSDEVHDIAVVDLRTHRTTVLFRGVYARYAPTGHIIYANAEGGLFAIAFDEGKLTTSGAPIPLVSGITRGDNGVARFALSATGTLLYGTGLGDGNHRLEWVDRQGREQLVDTTFTGVFGELALSPDGRRLAIARYEGVPSIWTKELDAGPVSKLTLQGSTWGPAWMPDGRSVSFTSQGRSGPQELQVRRADGSTNPEPLLTAARNIEYGFVSRDGQWIVYVTNVTGSPTGRDLFARRLSGDTSTIALAATNAQEISPRLSPDSRWLAFASNESGQIEIYVSPFPNTSTSRTVVSLNGGSEPLWSRDGRELFYTGAANSLTAARVELTPTFRVISRTPLFDRGPYNRESIGAPFYDVAPDGKRFIMTRVRGESTERLVVVLNWFQELAARK